MHCNNQERLQLIAYSGGNKLVVHTESVAYRRAIMPISSSPICLTPRFRLQGKSYYTTKDAPYLTITAHSHTERYNYLYGRSHSLQTVRISTDPIIIELLDTLSKPSMRGNHFFPRKKTDAGCKA